VDITINEVLYDSAKVLLASLGSKRSIFI
jgi:hypothetical protein